MKLIEALKEVKLIDKKIGDLVEKIRQNSVRRSIETSPYQDPVETIKSWTQSGVDLVHRRDKLLAAIFATNASTVVEIKIGGSVLKKTITEWLLRRNNGVGLEERLFKSLTDRGLKEEVLKQTDGSMMEIKILRHFNAEERDQRLAILMEEPSLIDSALEIVNATTEIVGM